MYNHSNSAIGQLLTHVITSLHVVVWSVWISLGSKPRLPHSYLWVSLEPRLHKFLALGNPDLKIFIPTTQTFPAIIEFLV